MATTTQFDSYFFGSGLVDDARKGVAQAVARTRAAGLPVEWRAYSMGHNLCRPEIFDIAAWLKYHLALDPPTGQ